MGEVDHRRVEAVDGPMVGVEWPSVKAESVTEGIEDAVAVVGGDGDGVAIAVGYGAVAGVGLAAVSVVVVEVEYHRRRAGFSGKFQLSSLADLVGEALVVLGTGIALMRFEAVSNAGWWVRFALTDPLG